VSEQRVEAAARELLAARAARRPFGGFRADRVPRDETEAYAIQDALADALSTGEGPLGGWKIGCTTPVMQKFMNIDSPCAGRVLAETVHQSPAAIACDRFQQLGVECEIAVRLVHDLTVDQAPFSRAAVARAVGSVAPAIEVVEDRYIDYGSLDVLTLIADNFFAAGCVLGPPVPVDRAGDLAEVSGRLVVNGEEVGAGLGSEVLGHPLEALHWLADHAMAHGRPLRAGEIILLGSLVQTRWVGPGELVRVALDPLGEASLRLVGDAARSGRARGAERGLSS
jgi:2-oxo-3-hexenedioate decarboxylase/2-keto-4-pentenoate hydratase